MFAKKYGGVVALLSHKNFVSVALLLIITGAFFVRLYKIDNPVADWHSWRQVDTASVSKVFVEQGVDLLRPRYHDISSIQTNYFNPEGYRFVEFPLFNLVHAAFFQTFPALGLDVWGRLVSIFSALLATFFVFQIARTLFDKWEALLSAFFYAFLPYNIYFTRTILPDTMSVMLGVAAVCFFVFYTDKKNLKWLLASSVMFSLAMLVKPHAIFFAIPVLYLALTRFKLSELFSNKWHFVALDIALIPFLLWRVWMYREAFIRGIANWEWAFNGNNIRFKPAFWNWIFGERIGRLILGVWGAAPVSYALISAKKLNILHAFWAGALLYVSVFATANVMHDYYQLFLIPAIALSLGVGFKKMWDVNNLIARAAVAFIVFLMFIISLYHVKDNYKVNDLNIMEAGRAADEILPKDALVIASYNGDTTFLYQTGRWGWPVVTTSIDRLIEMGAQYYVSVNFEDRDTIEYRERFETLAITDKYIIIDLTREKT